MHSAQCIVFRVIPSYIAVILSVAKNPHLKEEILRHFVPQDDILRVSPNCALCTLPQPSVAGKKTLQLLHFVKVTKNLIKCIKFPPAFVHFTEKKFLFFVR